MSSTLLVTRLDVDLVLIWFQDDMAVRSLSVDRYLLASDRTCLLAQDKSPEDGGSKDEHLVIDNVLAKTCASTPSEGMHGMTIAEIGILGKRLLVSRPRRLKPSLWTERLRIGILGLDTVDIPIINPLALGKFRAGR